MKVCCRNFYEAEVVPRGGPILLYLSHEMLYTGSRVTYGEVSRRAARLPGVWMGRVLGALQWFLSKDSADAGYKTGLSFLKEFGDPLLARKAEAWFATGKSHRLLHRSTIPALLQVRMMAEPTTETEPTEEAMRELGTLLPMVNDLLEEDFERGKGNAATSRGVDLAFAASLFRNGFYSHMPHWGAATARNWALLTEGSKAVLTRKPGEHVDVSASYRDHVGVSALDLLAVALGLVAYYSALTRDDFNREPQKLVIADRFMDQLGSESLKTACRAVLRQLSASWEDHVQSMQALARGPRDNVQQFFSIYNTPLMRDGDVYALLDLEFVKSQTTEGWYWTLVRALSEAGLRERVHQLHVAYGHAFEWYCSEMAAPLRARDPSIQVWTDWNDEIEAVGDGQSLPDVLVRDHDILFVVEATAAAVPPAIAVSCDPGRLGKALTHVWFGDSPKLRQLAKAREGVLNGRVLAKGLDVSTIRRVIPLLVSLRYVPRHLGIWHWYRDIMLANGLSQAFAETVQIMDSEDWEEFCATGLEGRGLAKSFDEWQRSPWARQAFQDWRAGTIGPRSVHPTVAEHLDSLWKAMPKEFRM